MLYYQLLKGLIMVLCIIFSVVIPFFVIYKAGVEEKLLELTKTRYDASKQMKHISEIYKSITVTVTASYCMGIISTMTFVWVIS